MDRPEENLAALGYYRDMAKATNREKSQADVKAQSKALAEFELLADQVNAASVEFRKLFQRLEGKAIELNALEKRLTGSPRPAVEFRTGSDDLPMVFPWDDRVVVVPLGTVKPDNRVKVTYPDLYRMFFG